MRIMALDVGDKTIGVAVSDGLGITAQGIEVIRRKSWVKDFARLAELIDRYEVFSIIIGLPRNMNGSEGERAEICRRFGQKLAETFAGIEIHFHDERLTTIQAERMLIAADVKRKKRKAVNDMVAAVLILQNYLECKA